MCTLTYLPDPIHPGDFILGSNRDESPSRPRAKPPAVKPCCGVMQMGPVDGKAGGSWISVAENGRLMTVMNGAYAPHLRQPPYKKSRGLLITEGIAFKSAPDFARSYDFFGIEPFTMILIDRYPRLALYELKWDGAVVSFRNVRSDKPHIWSSDNLFSSEVRRKREIWFETWQKEAMPNGQDLLKFHLEGGGEAPDEEKIRMSRGNKVRSVSTTIVTAVGDSWEMSYRDHLTERAGSEAGNVMLPCREPG